MKALWPRLGRRRFLAALPFAALSACAEQFQDPYPPQDPDARMEQSERDLGHLTCRAVDRLLRTSPPLSPSTPIIVSSITDTEQLDHSSRFGNLIADLARSRLAQRGMAVSEPRLRSTMLLRQEEGEMMLGREAKALVAPPMFSYVLTGTYAAGNSTVFVALKLISENGDRIQSAVDFVVWRTKDINVLLA